MAQATLWLNKLAWRGRTPKRTGSSQLHAVLSAEWLNINFGFLSCRAKEALAAKATAEQERQAMALQLETAAVRARECEENERAAEDFASQHKVRRLVTILVNCFSSEEFSTPCLRLQPLKLPVNY